MEVNVAEATLFLLESVGVVIERLLVLAKHLVALACVHVVLSKLLLVPGVTGSLLGTDRRTKVVERALILLKVHVAAPAHRKSGRKV